MNIGIVTTWFERGASYVSKAYLEALSKEHHVFVYARGGESLAKGNPKWDKEYVTWGKQVDGWSWTCVDWKDFREWITSNRLDILIFNEQKCWAVILKLLSLEDIIIGSYIDYYTPETVPFFQLYDFLFCNTKRHFEVFQDYPQTFYIPWGTDCETFQQSDEQESEQVRFFHSAGMLGVNNRKGTDILVRAFQNVRGKAKLIIHSQVELSKYPNETASLIDSDKRIKFIQAILGPPGLYHLGDVYVYPTRLEGIGLTIPEALASGLPVITTNTAPMNEFVIHGSNGWLVEVSKYRTRPDCYYWPESICSEEALTEGMQFFVDNKNALGDYKRRARESAEKHLDIRKNFSDLPEIVKDLSRKREFVDRRLVDAVYEYERIKKYSVGRKFNSQIESILRKAGLGKVKRWLANLSS